MTLCDTGPLVALINSNDPAHSRSTANLLKVRRPLATTEACLTEALHLLDRATGWPGQQALWKLVKAGTLQIVPSQKSSALLARDFMEQFRDQPCDYADATLLVAAEQIGCNHIFTIDPHFHAYRLTNGNALKVVG